MTFHDIHLDKLLSVHFLPSINDYESCAEMLLDTLGDEIVNLCDKRDRYEIMSSVLYSTYFAVI